VPGAAVSCCPSRSVPEIDGAARANGLPAATTSVAALSAVRLAAALVAVTAATMRWPRSAATSVYVALVAPPIGAQAPPGTQRCHP
jgi:hypothetical protein